MHFHGKPPPSYLAAGCGFYKGSPAGFCRQTFPGKGLQPSTGYIYSIDDSQSPVHHRKSKNLLHFCGFATTKNEERLSSP